MQIAVIRALVGIFIALAASSAYAEHPSPIVKNLRVKGNITLDTPSGWLKATPGSPIVGIDKIPLSDLDGSATAFMSATKKAAIA